MGDKFVIKGMLKVKNIANSYKWHEVVETDNVLKVHVLYKNNYYIAFLYLLEWIGGYKHILSIIFDILAGVNIALYSVFLLNILFPTLFNLFCYIFGDDCNGYTYTFFKTF